MKALARHILAFDDPRGAWCPYCRGQFAIREEFGGAVHLEGTWPEKTAPAFRYWWEGFGPAGDPVAFYAMPIDGGSSDVTAETLAAGGYEIPETPTLAQWIAAGRPGKAVRQ